MASLILASATGAEPEPPAAPGRRPRGLLAEFWYYFSDNPGAVGGLFTIAVIIVLALLADQVAAQSPIEIQFADIVRPEEMENRERARPHSQRYAANSGAGTKAEHADWDPLNYRPGR